MTVKHFTDEERFLSFIHVTFSRVVDRRDALGSLGLNTVEKDWDNVNAELNKIYNKDIVIFRHFNATLYIFK